MDKKKLLSICKLTVLLLIAAGVPAYILIFHHDLITRFQSYDEVVYYLRS